MEILHVTVYTGRGDKGRTDLFGGQRTEKDSLRVEAYGAVDELNALLGRIRPTGFADIDTVLTRIQNRLFTIQAELANPADTSEQPSITATHVEDMEDWIDRFQNELSSLDHFILPSGTDIGAALHHSRAVCRRAERRIVSLDREEDVDADLLTFMNRLSDGLFTLARVVNEREGVDETEPRHG